MVVARLLLTVADLPATKKLIGAVSHAHGIHPCHHCGVYNGDLSSPIAYDWRALPPKLLSPKALLGEAFRHEDTRTSAQARLIEDTYGVRYSVLNKLIGMEHSKSAPLDHLHNLYLGLVKSFINILTQNDMFEGDIEGRSRAEVFSSIFNQAQYPGHLGKLPSGVTKQMMSGKAAGLKADQWKRVSQLLVHALSKPRRSDEADIPFKRNRKLWFGAAVSLCSGIRVLDSHKISLSDAEAATEDLAICARTMISLGAKLTINWHNAMHYPLHVKLFGPIGGYSTWALERNNGSLSRVKHNMKEKDIPSTLLRAWLREALLAAVLHNPAPDISATERAAIELLLADRLTTLGTVMLNEILIRRNITARLPPPMKISPVNLKKYPAAYECLLAYVQLHHPEYDFVGRITVGDRRPCLPVTSERYLLHTHVVHQGFKFCSALYNRTVRDQYALACLEDEASRELVQVRLFLSATLVVKNRPDLELRLALVDKFQKGVPDQAWGYRSIDLGYRIYHDRHEAGGPLFIPIAALQASVIVSKFDQLITCVSCDREGQEPEFWLDSDDPQADALGLEDARGETDDET
ncbi:hypothetical protein FFLO_04108 [Filobasidium floriforme]|uniref:Uncharacterized protein n=1 Tax=Filobasidium floriforme TaxID=5210 RepID=A0A8K0JJH6_9TREE|nr:hypothetical protein FFLO_04108 [Filobasidium floriforme]